MPSFGGISCSLINGVSDYGMREVVRTWAVTGVDGHGFQRIGKRGAPYDVKLVVYDTVANCLAWARQIGDLQSSTVSFLNDLGQTSPPHMVESVSRPVITVAVGENGGFRGELRARVRAVA